MVAQAMVTSPLRTSMLHMPVPKEQRIMWDSDLAHEQRLSQHRPHLAVLQQ